MPHIQPLFVAQMRKASREQELQNKPLNQLFSGKYGQQFFVDNSHIVCCA